MPSKMSDRYHEPRQSGRMIAADILLLVLAVFLPPLVAFLKRGCGSQLLLNILLDFLGVGAGCDPRLVPRCCNTWGTALGNFWSLSIANDWSPVIS
ncbi:hypothetical protein FJTKL_00242 [Diaporthe vaccinii]|uniref:Uncharacterized protein n=1 Tax=Diaporthe vaccinii TaxID=105482 RepID=A0ABR4E3W7_9PEZI